MDSIQKRILLVDDDQHLLDAIERCHRKQFDLITACGGEEGLKILEGKGPIAVVVSDYQMPGMNGIEFLEKVRARAPGAVRIMLTGNADLGSAVEAVNKGHVFRFLTKPCEQSVLADCLRDALEQHRLENVERALLEQTVRGSIEVLAGVLSLVNPDVFGRSIRVQGYVSQLVSALGLPDPWRYETAALLSQIGFVAVPANIVERLALGGELRPDHQEMIDQHPQVAQRLLRRIPRLEAIADMIGHQHLPYARLRKGGLERDVVLGAEILAVSLAFDEFLSLGAGRADAIRAMSKEVGRYSPRLLGLLSGIASPDQGLHSLLLPVRSLKTGMILDQDVRNEKRVLIVAKGNKVTEGMLASLMNHLRMGSIPGEVRVLRTERDAPPADAA